MERLRRMFFVYLAVYTNHVMSKVLTKLCWQREENSTDKTTFLSIILKQSCLIFSVLIT